MSNMELDLIASVCESKQIGPVLVSGSEQLFNTYDDVWGFVKEYYGNYKSVPDFDIVRQNFKDIDTPSVTADTGYYLEKLQDSVLRGKLENLFINGANALGGNAPVAVLEKLVAETAKLSQLSSRVQDLDITDVEQAELHFLSVRERARELGSVGIKTGFKAIDDVYPTGLAPGHLVVIIGWSGKAKTWFSGLLAVRAWQQGFKPMIVSLEMSPEAMRDRLWTTMGDGVFNIADLQRGDVQTDTVRSWAGKSFKDKPGFVIVGGGGEFDVTPQMIQGKIEQHRPDVLFLDYHQLLTDNRRSNGATERAMNVSREIKRLATMNGIPVVDITAATADEISDKENPPSLSQVAWSKAIEYDADLALSVHRYNESGLIAITSEKNRHGSEFAFHLEWDLANGKIKERYDL